MTAYRFLLACSMTLLAAAGVVAALTLSGGSVYAATYTVNSTADTDDATCDVANCTLREAIDASNASAGLDLIDFDATVFPAGNPAIIALTSELPTIFQPLTIDGTGAGVIIEPAAGMTVQWGFYVVDDDFPLPFDPTDFTAINLTLRGFTNDPGDDTSPPDPNPPDGDAIYVCGADFILPCGTQPVDGVTLDNVTAYGNTGDGLDVDADGAENISVDGSDLYALGGDGVNVCCGTSVSVTNSEVSAIGTGIYVEGGGTGSDVDITGNSSIVGGAYGIRLLLCTMSSSDCTGTTNDVLIDGNGSILGSDDPGIYTEICVDQLCDGTTNDFSVTDNDYISNAGFDQAIRLNLCYAGVADCDGATNTVHIDGNTEIAGHYRGIEAYVCYSGSGCDDSVNTLTVDNNDVLRSGQDDTVGVGVCSFASSGAGCGDGGGPQTISVSNNTLITGADGDELINLDLCLGNSTCLNTTASITIDNNGEFDGAYNAIEADLCDTCDGTAATVNIRNNGPIFSGEDDVIEIDMCNTSCNSIASPQALASAVINISDNDTITGADSDQAMNIDMCDGSGGCNGLGGGTPIFMPVTLNIIDNGTIWGGDDVLELDQCNSSGPCDYSNVAVVVTGHPGGLNAVEDDTFDFDQCVGLGSCSYGDVTFDVYDNGPLSAGDDAEVFDVGQCSSGRLCAMGTHSISIMDNGEMDSINEIFDGNQCDSSDDGSGCPDSTNTFTLANHPLLRAGDSEVVNLDQCTFFGPADTVGCNNSTNTVSITGNGPSFAADDSFDIDQCQSFGADETTDHGCDNSTNLIEAMNNGDSFNSDEGIFVFDQCESDATVAGARACHNSTNTIRVTGNGDNVATDGDSVLEVDQCNGLGCDGSDNYVIFTNNGYGNADDEVIEVDQCRTYDEEAAGCNGGINSIEVTGNGDMLSEAYEVVHVNQCTGDYGSCNSSMISTLVDDNGFLWGGNSSDRAFEVDQCTSTICNLSDVSLTVTDHPGIIGHDGIFDIDICSFERYDTGLAEYVPGSCAGTDIDVVLERNGRLQALTGEGLEADICYFTLCSVYVNGGPIATTVDLSLADHLGIAPINSDDIVRMNLCRGDESGCVGLSGTRMPVNITIDNNGPMSATYQGFDVNICSFSSNLCDYADIDFNVTDHPSISALSDEVFDFAVCSGLADNSGIGGGIGSCLETTVDLNLERNGDIFSGPQDEGAYVEVCFGASSVDFCDNLDVTFNFRDNGPMFAGSTGITVIATESTAMPSPYDLEVNIERSAIAGLDGHGVNLVGYFTGGSIDDNVIVGLGTHDDGGGTVYHDGINFGDEFGVDDAADPQAEVTGMSITNNTISDGHGRGVNMADMGSGNTIDGNTIEDNFGAGVALSGAGLTGNTVSNNNILGNGGTGVLITDSSGNTIGPANVIEDNGTGGTGVVVLGSGADGNTITENDFDSNVGLGIDLNDDGVTANDGGDGDTGPNEEQNFPENLALVGTEVQGDTCPSCTVELHLITMQPDPTGHGEGFYAATTTANGSGDFSFDLAVIDCTNATHATTTATDGSGNTSEFSDNLDVSSVCPSGPTASPTPSPTPAGTGRPTRTPGNGGGSATATPTATPTPTASPTASPTPSPTPSGGATPRPTRTPMQ